MMMGLAVASGATVSRRPFPQAATNAKTAMASRALGRAPPRNADFFKRAPLVVGDVLAPKARHAGHARRSSVPGQPSDLVREKKTGRSRHALGGRNVLTPAGLFAQSPLTARLASVTYSPSRARVFGEAPRRKETTRMLQANFTDPVLVVSRPDRTR